MRKVVLREKVDLIHSHLDDQNFYSSIVGRLTGCPTIATYHGAPRIAVQQGARRAIKLWAPRRFASQIVVVSDYLRDIFLKSDFPPERTHRIYNGVDLASFSGSEAAGIRGELGLSENVRLVGTIANLRHSKGYEYFVESCRVVADAVPEAYFVAVGETEKILLGRLKERIRELRLEQRFFFLGFRPDIPQLLKDLDVFVLASTDEGLSIATIEAMAASRPVVATLSGGPQEIVCHAETGFLVPVRDPLGLAARIIQILQDPAMAERMGHAARADVEERFSLAKMISAYEALYLNCLGGN
jgi:glycosyltransferase involved in cell wall biosynthesis